MDSTALQNARKRRDELAAERNRVLARADELKRLLNRVDQFINDHVAFEADELPGVVDPWDALNALPDRERMIVAAPEGGPDVSVSRPPRNSKKEDVAATAHRIIAAEGKPVPRTNLLTLLINEGLVIGGAAPETVLSTMLWRTRDTHGVIHLRNLGYWLKDKPLEEAGYIPGLDELMGVEDDAPEQNTGSDYNESE